MSDTKRSKTSIRINCGLITVVFVVLSILLSTGIWQPSSNFFLWEWLTFRFGHILVPILTILFVPVVVNILIAVCVIVVLLPIFLVLKKLSK